MKQILIIILSIMLISLVSGEVQTLGEFKQNYCVNLIQSCSNCTFTNITSVLYPTSTIAISDKTMTQIGTMYNYSFCNTKLSGKYIVNGISDVNGINTPWAYDFTILGIGYSGDKNITEIAFFILVALLLAGFIYIKISKFLGSLLIFIIGFGVLFTIPENGWIAWIVIASGFLMTLYALLAPSKRGRR